MEKKEQNTPKSSSYMFGAVKAVIDFKGKDSEKFLQYLNDAGYKLSEIDKEQNTGMSLESDKCIAFAEWILKEGFEKYEDNGKCWWGKFSDDKDYSTIQLFEMWSNSDASQPIISGWVSVEERLPELDQTVLFFDKDLKATHFGHLGENGRMFITNGVWYTREEVTHWMPLPSYIPPKQFCPQCKIEFTKEELLTNEHCFKCGFEMKEF
jgi:hypothetical protein